MPHKNIEYHTPKGAAPDRFWVRVIVVGAIVVALWLGWAVWYAWSMRNFD